MSKFLDYIRLSFFAFGLLFGADLGFGLFFAPAGRPLPFLEYPDYFLYYPV